MVLRRGVIDKPQKSAEQPAFSCDAHLLLPGREHGRGCFEHITEPIWQFHPVELEVTAGNLSRFLLPCFDLRGMIHGPALWANRTHNQEKLCAKNLLYLAAHGHPTLQDLRAILRAQVHCATLS